MITFVGRTSNKHRRAPYVLEFNVYGKQSFSSVKHEGKSYDIKYFDTHNKGFVNIARISKLPFMTESCARYECSITEEGVLVFVREKKDLPEDVCPPKPKSVREYDDSFPRARRKVVAIGTRIPSEGQRKKSEFLEAELQRRCVSHALAQGITVRTWDNDGYPDQMFWLNKTFLGAAEFKSPTGSPTEQQEARIKELREYHDDPDMFRIFRVFENFKAWLDHRIELLGRQSLAVAA